MKGGRPLSVGVIKQMHAALLRHESTTLAVDLLGREFSFPLLHGAYKTMPNNPLRKDGLIHEYCRPEHVASEMDRLIEAHARHEKEQVAAEVEAA
ncbi:MAG: hypothetical protein ACK6DX_05610 [Acidobacteriota bacterium]